MCYIFLIFRLTNAPILFFHGKGRRVVQHICTFRMNLLLSISVYLKKSKFPRLSCRWGQQPLSKHLPVYHLHVFIAKMTGIFNIIFLSVLFYGLQVLHRVVPLRAVHFAFIFGHTDSLSVRATRIWLFLHLTCTSTPSFSL
jgi:hypothetical protein